MANRRMFSKEIVESGDFYDLPSTAQNLYFHLNMNADDRGYVNNARQIMCICNATLEDLKLLINRKFVLLRKEKYILIKGWRINNQFPISKIVESKYYEDLATLYYDDNNSYTEKETKFPVLQSNRNRALKEGEEIREEKREEGGKHKRKGEGGSIGEYSEGGGRGENIDYNSKHLSIILNNQEDNILNGVRERLEKYFNSSLSQFDIEEIKQWIKEYPSKFINECLEFSIKRNCKSLKYITVILKSKSKELMPIPTTTDDNSNEAEKENVSSEKLDELIKLI